MVDVKNKTILFVSKGEDSSSTRYRAQNYLPLFREAGWSIQHQVDDRTLRSRWLILLRAGRSDVVVILRRTYWRPFLSALRRRARLLVFDFDDAIFLKSSGGISHGRRSRFVSTAKACDIIWAGNSYLADQASKASQNVHVIPTSLDPDKYNVRPEKPSDKIVLVWIGSRSTRKHLITALPYLETAARQIPSLQLKIIADFALDSEVLEIQAVRWTAQSEAAELASAHIGIAPLPDNPWTQGKCGLKVLQYMAAGLPVISSPTGVNADLVEHGRTGFLAESAADWISAVRTLAANAEQRIVMGQLGRERCVQQFSLDTTFQRLLATLSR